MRPFAPAFVPPGIDDEENENHQAEEEQNYRPGFVVPKLLKAPGEFVEIHSLPTLHQFSQKQDEI
jgi:hypothetical protein